MTLTDIVARPNMEEESYCLVLFETQEQSDENQPPPDTIHDLVCYNDNKHTIDPPLKLTPPENRALALSVLDSNKREEDISLICTKFEQKGQLIIRKTENKMISKEEISKELAVCSTERNIVNCNKSKEIIVIQNDENQMISKEENSKEVTIYNKERNIVNPNVSKEVVSYDSNFESIWIPLRKDIIEFKVRNVIQAYSLIMTIILITIIITIFLTTLR